jgi:hypothetical protein
MTKILGGSKGVLDVLEKKRYLSPAEIQYPDHPAGGLDAMSITGLQTIKRKNGNTFATNTGVFSYFPLKICICLESIKTHFPSYDKISLDKNILEFQNE